MYIKRVVIENIRGFRQLDFDLEHGAGSKNYAGWTVFTGDNGSGKTALLKAIALAVNGPDLSRALQPSFQGWVRQGAGVGTIAVTLVAGEEDTWKGGGRTGQELVAGLEVVDEGEEPTLRPKSTKKKGPKRGPWSEKAAGWFSCGYGPFRRLYGESSDAMRLMRGPGPLARFATMFREDASLTECEEWLKELKFRSLDREEDSPILEAVKDLLNDDFMQTGMSIEKIDSEGLHVRDQSGIVLPLVDMSDGYRAALALLVDIVRHMVAVYGGEHLVIRDDRGRIVVDRPGVVLIDEIDSHLHPEWQRRIGFWLKQRFPRLQFVVTTHSPLICQAADLQGIFHLPPPGSQLRPYQLEEEEYAEVVCSKPDTILLSRAFGLRHTRSPRAVAQRDRFAQLKSKKDAGFATPDEEKELARLAQELQPLFANTAQAGE
jgi:hypothetical protein